MPRAQRKQLKQRARRSVKQHYGVMLSVCLLAILLGTEFTGSLDFLKVQTPTDVKVEREVLEESEFGIEQNSVWKVVTTPEKRRSAGRTGCLRISSMT